MNENHEAISALDRAVAEHIRVLAARKNLKQADIADAIGMQRPTFSRYWNMKRSMKLSDLEAILAALGTDYGQEREAIRRLMDEGK